MGAPPPCENILHFAVTTRGKGYNSFSHGHIASVSCQLNITFEIITYPGII